MFDTNLIKIRIVSFAWSLLSLIGMAMAAVLLSPDFSRLVVQHFGAGTASTLIVLAITELVKHVRNVKVTNDAYLLGGDAKEDEVVLI